MGKPLARWVIGNVSNQGFDVLQHSLRHFQQNHSDFDCLVCYNEIGGEKLRRLESLGVDLYQQDKMQDDRVWGAVWKVYPPRLRMDSHEIVMDNDVVIKDRMPVIDEFLRSNTLTLVTEAYGRNYGQFDSLIPAGIKINTGFYGLPPGYDFEACIKQKIPDRWESHFDKQGIVASCLLQQNLFIIPMIDISVNFKRYVPGKYGEHFVGVNENRSNSWTKYTKGVL